MKTMKLSACALVLATLAGTASAASPPIVAEVLVRNDNALLVRLNYTPYTPPACSTNETWDLLVPGNAPASLRGIVMDAALGRYYLQDIRGTGSCVGNIEQLKFIDVYKDL